MLLLNTSVFEVIRFIPPLTVSEEEIAKGLEIFERALMRVFPHASNAHATTAHATTTKSGKCPV
jgi:hypothetical protein